jgi:hypothetical protein
MTIFGLPLHVLMVHAVVVLVPLASVGGIAIATMRWARLRYGSLVLVGAFGATVSTFIAQQAGEDFQRSFARPTAAMEKHFAIGGSLFIWVLLLFVGTAVVMLGQWLIDRDHSRGTLVLLVGTAVTVVCAVVSIIQVIRIGHSGAVAVWGGA